MLKLIFCFDQHNTFFSTLDLNSHLPKPVPETKDDKEVAKDEKESDKEKEPEDKDIEKEKVFIRLKTPQQTKTRFKVERQIFNVH